MTVFKKGRSWVAQVYLGADEDGRKRYVSKSAATKRDAHRLEAEMRVQAAEGRLKASPAKTVEHLLNRWLETAELSVTTRYGYSSVIEHHIKPALGQVRIRSLSTEQLERFYRSLALPVEGTLRSGRTIRNVHAILRSALTVAVRWGWIGHNPALLAAVPRQGTPKRVTAPSLEQVAAILDAAKAIEPDFHAALFLEAVTGLRRGELCGLRWSDVDLKAGRILVRRSIVEVGGQIHEKDTKTHAERSLAIGGDATRLLAEVERRWRDRARRAEVSPIDGYVFSSDPLGVAPLRPGVLSSRFRRAREAAKAPEVRFHDVRHAVATHLIAAGVDIVTVAGRLGHADSSTTLRVYSHVVEQADAKAAEALSSLLAEARSGGSVTLGRDASH